MWEYQQAQGVFYTARSPCMIWVPRRQSCLQYEYMLEYPEDPTDVDLYEPSCMLDRKIRCIIWHVPFMTRWFRSIKPILGDIPSAFSTAWYRVPSSCIAASSFLRISGQQVTSKSKVKQSSHSLLRDWILTTGRACRFPMIMTRDMSLSD